MSHFTHDILQVDYLIQ